jgi:hypothetical protein
MFFKMCGAGVLGLAGVSAGSAKNRKRRPNIIFIFIDDMGYTDPSCFGNPSMKTPNIDRLAADGLRLTQFYTNSPICSPFQSRKGSRRTPQSPGQTPSDRC